VWGNSDIAVRRVLLSAMEEGARARFLRLTDLKLEPCRGCFKCLSPARACAISDDLAKLLDQVASADAMVLAAPVYFGLPAAVLVGLLDRLLAAAPREDLGKPGRTAVTVTLMGNREWRGVAEPFVNLAASLLGFNVMESVAAVAEGPGEILRNPEVVGRLRSSGRTLAAPSALGQCLVGEALQLEPHAFRASTDIGTFPDAGGRREIGQGECSTEPTANSQGLLGRGAECPVCRSDFFRIESGHIVCPVCGARGDLAAYATEGRFVRIASEVRWGRAWLMRHVASWILPSVERYKSARKQALEDLRELRRQYSLKEAERSKS
jgi:multimeric flavodoxin WrbA/uncharacterized Zn finger protein (UPF0148 family)